MRGRGARRILAAAALTAALAVAGPCAGVTALADENRPARGSPETPEEELLPEEFSEELEEGLEDGMSEDDLDRMIEHYFSQIDVGEIGTEIEAEVVVNPALRMERETDGGIRYTLPNGNYFITTAPRGMVSSRPVDVRLSSGIVGVLKKDDVLDLMPDSWHFAGPGNYHIKMLSYQPASGSSGDYNVYEVNYYFTVVGGTDGRLGAVPAPEGFAITEVRLDGQPQPLEDERCFFLTADGRYEIRYADRQQEEILLETAFVHDTTAPFLSFSKEPEGKEAEGPLEFFPSEPDCRVILGYNGEQGYAVSNVLTAAGSYELCVEDAAGNKRSYYLRIRQTYDLLDPRLMAAGIVILAGLAVWMVSLRKNMKVI